MVKFAELSEAEQQQLALALVIKDMKLPETTIIALLAEALLTCTGRNVKKALAILEKFVDTPEGKTDDRSNGKSGRT